MYIRLTLSFLIATTIACGTSGPGDTPTASSFPSSTPAIVQQSIEFHGGALYEASTITMTISSLSGSFESGCGRSKRSIAASSFWATLKAPV